VLLGEAAERFKKALEGVGYDSLHLASSMPEAVRSSLNLGRKGEIVLLSPACASFDMYANFEERGKDFKKAVNDLK
jgi:UDP-N-acetylmuramoylalanine--D-glutamate ligase